MRLLLFAIATFFPVLVTAHPLVLSTDGNTEYVIVLPAEPAAVEQTAAKELKEHLDSVTGGDFAVVSESEADVSKPQLVVGNSKRAKELLPQLDIAKIPYDGIVIKSVGKNLVLVGHPQRGTLYAVYSFLEDVVGVRWWTATESFIPKKPTLEVPQQNVEYAPKLIYREAFYHGAFDGVFASRAKCNGDHAKTTSEYGGHHRFFQFVHTFFLLLPPATYFEKHPEWYSEINGRRTHEHSQLCLTNDEMRAELTKNALEILRKNPDVQFLSVSQNDGGPGYCTCEKCKAVDDEEGSQSGTMVRFVNKVAEDIEKEFPNIWVETLAYSHTRIPPKLVKPRKNVVIRLCTHPYGFSRPMTESERYQPFREAIQGWSKIADNLFIWYSTANYRMYLLPNPTHRAYGPNVRFFVDHNAIGIFAEGQVPCPAGDFIRMESWVISHLLWNPSLDADKLYDEFLIGYYGPKYGPLLKEYLNILHDRVEHGDVHLTGGQLSTKNWLDCETWSKAIQSLGDLDAREESEYFKRFERDSLPIRFVSLLEFDRFQRELTLSGKSVTGTILEAPQKLLDDFFRICREYNVQKIYTQITLKTFEADIRAKFSSSTVLPEFCKELPKSSWLDVQSIDIEKREIGKWTFSVDDEKASNKRAIKMPGDHGLSATRYHFDDSLLDLTPTQAEGEPQYRLYAAVRCDAKEGIEGKAMTLNVHDVENDKSVVVKVLSVANIRGPEYHWIDMGVIPLRPKHQFTFSPPNRPDEVDAVYIDRIVVVREN